MSENRKHDRRSKFKHCKKKNNKFLYDEDRLDQFKLNKQFKHKKQSIKDQENWDELESDEL